MSLSNFLIWVYILRQDVLMSYYRSKILRSWRKIRSWTVLEMFSGFMFVRAFLL